MKRTQDLRQASTRGKLAGQWLHNEQAVSAQHHEAIKQIEKKKFVRQRESEIAHEQATQF